MDTITKLYMTGALIVNMAIVNYCYNTFGLSPDYSFFRMDEPVAYIAPLRQTEKARFISNYTPVYDNVVSSMAIFDDTLSAGALYIDYRRDIDKKLCLNGIQITLPCKKEGLGRSFKLKENIPYAGGGTAAEIYDGEVCLGCVRIKNGSIYRLSSGTDTFKADGIGVGDNIHDVMRRWGVPTKSETNLVHHYSIGSSGEITLITNSDGYITWMLYETQKELPRESKHSRTSESTETATEITSAAPKTRRRQAAYPPVAEAILSQGKEDKTK